MRCPCADSVLIIILGLVIALVGIFSIITHATLNSNLHPIVHCIAILLHVSPLCWIVFKSCSKLEEIHDKLQAVQPPSESHREKERKRTKRKKKKKRPSRINQPVQPPSHHEPSNETHPKKPNATKKKAKKGELGVSVYHLEKVFQGNVHKFYEAKKKEKANKKNSSDKAGDGNNAGQFKSIEDKEFDEINIYDIDKGVIRPKGLNVRCPRDGKMGAAYVDCLEGEDHVGEANIMLSYAWGNSLVDILDVLKKLCKLLQIDIRRAYVWICCLCNNQHRFEDDKTFEFDELEEIFRSKVVDIGIVVSLLAPYHDPLYCRRAWCVFEANTAEHSDETQMHFMLPSREQQKLIDEILLTNKGSVYASNKLFDALRSVKIEDAEASKEQDKINILELVERTGGAAKLNHAVNDRLREWQLKVVREGCERLESESKDVGTDVDLARCFLNAGEIFRARGCFEEAFEFLWKCLKIRESVLGNDHEDTASIYFNIAFVYKSQGKYDDAMTYYSKCLTIEEKILGKEHQDTATTYNNIAAVYDNQGKYDDALTYYDKCLTIREKVLGKEHQSTATTYNNMALVYDNQGKYNDALTYYSKCLTIREKILGKEHQDTAATYNNIGLVYDNQGKYNDALTYYLKSLTIKEKILGKEHQSTATTYNNVAAVYRQQGKYNDALAYYSKCLTIREKILGKEHQSTATTYNNIGLVYDNQGKYNDALTYYLKCLTIEEKVLGKEHQDTAVTYYNIADNYECQGDLSNALQYYEKCLTMREKVLGSDHPKTLSTKSAVTELTEQLNKN